jgi:hypothetical protein
VTPANPYVVQSLGRSIWMGIPIKVVFNYNSQCRKKFKKNEKRFTWRKLIKLMSTKKIFSGKNSLIETKIS